MGGARTTTPQQSKEPGARVHGKGGVCAGVDVKESERAGEGGVHRREWVVHGHRTLKKMSSALTKCGGRALRQASCGGHNVDRDVHCATCRLAALVDSRALAGQRGCARVQLLEQLGLEGTQGTHNGVYAAARPHVERRVTIGACVGQQPSHAEADRRGRGCVLNVLFTPMSAAPGHRRGTATQRSSTDSLNHRRARTRRTRQFAKCTRCVVGRAVIDVPSV